MSYPTRFYVSWCINRKADGGLELPAKVTLETYGHLFPRGDGGGRNWRLPKLPCLGRTARQKIGDVRRKPSIVLDLSEATLERNDGPGFLFVLHGSKPPAQEVAT
jgi:hypothetical protein